MLVVGVRILLEDVCTKAAIACCVMPVIYCRASMGLCLHAVSPSPLRSNITVALLSSTNTILYLVSVAVYTQWLPPTTPHYKTEPAQSKTCTGSMLRGTGSFSRTSFKPCKYISSIDRDSAKNAALMQIIHKRIMQSKPSPITLHTSSAAPPSPSAPDSTPPPSPCGSDQSADAPAPS